MLKQDVLVICYTLKVVIENVPCSYALCKRSQLAAKQIRSSGLQQFCNLQKLLGSVCITSLPLSGKDKVKKHHVCPYTVVATLEIHLGQRARYSIHKSPIEGRHIDFLPTPRGRGRGGLRILSFEWWKSIFSPVLGLSSYVDALRCKLCKLVNFYKELLES